jgi:hypothetical protein
MVWDLGQAMRKKEEFESSRLMDFEFRQRARAAKLLASAIGIESATIVRAVLTHDDARLVDLVATSAGRETIEIGAIFQRCMHEARTQLIAERGDPTPYRLA